jgi:hypothetical protein
MPAIPSKRRSSFGIDCVQCDNEVIAPERSEYRDERQVLHFWHCTTCDYCFEVIAPSDTKSIKDILGRVEDIVTRHEISPLRLVA